MAAPWDAFADAPGQEAPADPWAAFEDAPKRSHGRRGRGSQRDEPSRRSQADDSIVRPVDGDTLRLTSGRDVRLPIVDAPELKQQGWDRHGNPVPIGQQGLDAITADITDVQTSIGAPIGQSYGRTVAPVAVDGEDLGLNLTREGRVIVDPRYLPRDEQQRYDYLQTERLARQNFRGVHGTMHQTPAEYRADPSYVPAREEVARFWDTPTPNAGLSKEAEQGYLAVVNDPRSTPQQIIAYAASVGAKLDPAEVDDFVAKRNAGYKVPQVVTYRDAPKLLTDPGDGITGATMRGVGNGVLPNMLEEVGAIPDTFGLTPGRENVFNSDRRLADIYHNNYEQNDAITGFDRSEHPYATGAGEIAGSLVVPMARVRSAADLGKWGAVYGGIAGLGEDGTISERLTSGVIGTGTGLVTTVVGGKALEAAAPYVARGARRLLGRGGERAEATPGGDFDGVSPLPDDFTVDGGPGVAAEPLPGKSGQAPQRMPISSDTISSPSADYPLDRPGIGMAAQPGASVSQSVRKPDYLFPDRPTRMDEPLTEAQLRARAENVDPRDVLPIPSNVVADVEEAAAKDAGRYVEAKAPHERGELTRQTVRNYAGQEVPKVGPIDLIGWLRLHGGINDAGDAVSKGGDLAGMGFTNASRKGLDFVGQEARFGPLLNERGMSLDDAAMRAWEAGYFPELTDRPDVNTFLEALRDTYNGTGRRRFLPEDQPEIERFYGAQSDRYALEQQRFETGETIYADRSVPADEPQPFPPPQAYEEWPAGGPDFAGNIRLEKLESPQDIKRALATTEKRVGFDAVTRGRVTQAETERLAADLGMTPDKLLSRRKGQALNAEEALAARQILAKSGNELVNAAKKLRALEEPGDDLLAEFRHKWMRHVAIQEQVAGATAEAGRALAQFKMAANSRAVRGDVLNALVRGGGGRHTLIEAADTLLDAVETSPGVFNALAQKATKPKWSRRIGELYINFLLSNPATLVVNVTSNTLTAMAQIPEHATAAMIGKARQAFLRNATDRVVASEVGARVFGLMQGAKEGARLFARAIKTGEASDYVAKVEGEEYRAIPGLAGEVIRIPTRLLTAEDELFKGIARRMELNGLAARQAHKEGLRGEAAKARIAELSADPTDALLQQATEYGRYLTFQSKLGPFAQSVSNAAQNNLVAKLYLPFVRTPTNLLKFAAERSPAAPFLPAWRKEFAAGGARRDLAVARMMLGTGFGLSIYQAALNGHITGAAPSDPKKARLLNAEGWQPYSVKIGDTYYSYKRLDPFAMTLGVAADLATLPEGMTQRQRDDEAALLVASIMGNLASKTWLSGVSDLVEALSDPARNTGNMLERLVGSLLVPAGVAGVARALDPTARETESIGEAIQARVPGMRDDLLPRRDIWGNEVKYDSGFLSPAYTSQAKRDPVNLELLKTDYAPGFVPKKVGGVELTPEQHDAYQEQSGKLAHQRLTELVKGSGWRSMDREERGRVAKQTVDKARKEVRERLFGAGKAEAADDEWSGFDDVPNGSSAPAKDDPWSSFKDPPERDVVGSLLRIPGVTMDGLTSGYRTPAYQADMKRRGYHPADDSSHLDGSSLDIKVPAGKSMGWLMAQVKRVEPDARLLPEGDHLHASFPGWYSAPVLGGAKAAGLRNPMADR